jgi:hypothetical protein
LSAVSHIDKLSLSQSEIIHKALLQKDREMVFGQSHRELICKRVEIKQHSAIELPVIVHIPLNIFLLISKICPFILETVMLFYLPPIEQRVTLHTFHVGIQIGSLTLYLSKRERQQRQDNKKDVFKYFHKGAKISKNQINSNIQ